MNMEQRLERVNLWLKSIYKRCPILPYEVNAKTVRFLYRLAESKMAKKRDMVLQIEDMRQRAAEHRAKAKYLQGILTQRLGIFPSSLSKAGTYCLNTLVKSAVLLQTNSASLASLFSAISDNTLELYKVESGNRKTFLKLKKMRDKITTALILETKLQKDLNRFENILEVRRARWNRESNTMIFLRRKSQELAVRIKNAQEDLIAVGLSQCLTHESLMKMSKKLDKVRKETQSVWKDLSYYQDLSPSILLAKVRIAEVKRELDFYDEELTNLICTLMSDLPVYRREYF